MKQIQEERTKKTKFKLCNNLVTRTITYKVDSSFCSKKEQQEFVWYLLCQANIFKKVFNEQKWSHFGGYLTLPLCHQLAHTPAISLLFLKNSYHILSNQPEPNFSDRHPFAHPLFLTEKAEITCSYSALKMLTRNEIVCILNEGHYSKIINEHFIDKPIVLTN